jgi:predicted nucleic acid-binding Zn ribbon protein
MQKFSDNPLTVHENCGGQVHRLLSAPALQFKGSGWYITDYARGGAKSADNGAKSSEAKTESSSKSETKSDSSSTSTPSTSSSTEKKKS